MLCNRAGILLRQMGDLQMLEDHAAELAMVYLWEISVFIKVRIMVSLLCHQSELRLSWERQCHNIWFDCEPQSQTNVILYTPQTTASYFVENANISVCRLLIKLFGKLKLRWWIFILCHNFPLQSFSQSGSEMSQSSGLWCNEGCQWVNTNSATE